MDPVVSNPLCLQCGLCCNGVIFADVQLQPADNVAHLWSLGLPLVQRNHRGKTGSAARPAPADLKFLQPCALLDGCVCRAYAERPKYCREFDCRLLQAVKAGRVKQRAALETIRQARLRADEVRALLRELGDDHEQVSLRARFRRMKLRLESNLPDEETAEIFGRLTLAVHDLNVLLSEAFYSEPGE